MQKLVHKTLISTPLLILLLMACSEENTSDTSLNIRLLNSSSFIFENVVVDTSTGNVEFGTLNPGEFSEYKEFETAYRYAFVELEIDDQIFTIQPVDYFGETPLENGRYTYQIDANES